MADGQRNWAAEAVAIVSGQSSLLPQREHLVALAQQAESALQNAQFLTALIIACMVDVNQHELVLPAKLLEHARTGGFNLAFTVARRGQTVYHVATLSRRPLPTVN